MAASLPRGTILVVRSRIVTVTSGQEQASGLSSGCQLSAATCRAEAPDLFDVLDVFTQEGHRFRGKGLATSRTGLQRHNRIPGMQHSLAVYIFYPHGAGRTNGRTRSTSNARIRLDMKGCTHLTF